MRTLPVIFLMIALSIVSHAQSLTSDVIRWDVTSLTDTNTQQTIAYTCHFITYPGDKIEWVQNNATTVLDLEQTTTAWTNLAADGQVIYAVEMNNNNGSITISRTGGTLQLKMDFMEGSVNQTPYTFFISNITVIEP